MKRKLQVFISSTYSDLIEERQAAVSAILKAGHIPAGMELFTAGDKSQMKVIEKWIDESDVYMLILGGRYGSIEPNSGLSYTELEYDYAIEQGKPFFAVVISEETLEAKVKSNGSAVMEKNNPKELAQFRDKVLSKISSFFSDPKDIKLCVHESMSDHEANPDLKGWVAADEIEDTKALNDEIKRLREENAALTGSLRKMEIAAQSRVKSADLDKNQELLNILRDIEIKVPAKLTGGEEITRSLLNISFNNKDFLINGITNHSGASALELFYYFNVLPKLQAHGLADNEKIAGVRYRRSYLNKAGQALFAALEKERLLSEVKSDQIAPNRENTEKLQTIEQGEDKPGFAGKTELTEERRVRAKKAK